MKLAIVVGTRPEIIRLSRIISVARNHYNTVLIHTGQNWDPNLKDVFFEQLKIREPDYYLNSVGKSLGETIGNIIHKSYELFATIKPDCLLILGDTNSCLCAISSKRLKIPTFHMEAGNRCFDQNVPEEINRKLVDHISDINLCYTENSRRYLLREGFRPDHIMVTGSPLTEVLNYYMADIQNSTILDKFNLKPNQFIVLSMHREENVDNTSDLKKIVSIINHVADKYKCPIIFPTHPRTRKQIKEHSLNLHSSVVSIDPLGLFDYCKLQKSSLCVISDSGSLAEEAAILNFKAVSLRNSTERPEAIDKGNIILSNKNEDTILKSIELAISMDYSPAPLDYTDLNVSQKVIKIIQSYTLIINKVIWFK